MVKHRARQVETFDDFTAKGSADLDIMIFLAGTTFVFASWICDEDNHSSDIPQQPVIRTQLPDTTHRGTLMQLAPACFGVWDQAANSDIRRRVSFR